MSNAPCKGCELRCPACHDRCLKYKDWLAIERKKKADIQKSAMNEVDTMHQQNIYKAKRRLHHG